MKFFYKATLLLLILTITMIACKNRTERVGDAVRDGNQKLKAVVQEGNAEVAETVRDERDKLNDLNADEDITPGEKLDAKLEAKENIRDKKVDATNEYLDARKDVKEDIKEEIND